MSLRKLPINYINKKVFNIFCRNIQIAGKEYEIDSQTNITEKIISKIGKNLHNMPHHPLGLIRQRINEYLQNITKFSVHDQLTPVVYTEQNFDSLLVPENHVSRNCSDSYYINKNMMLRSHTTAHDSDFIKKGETAFFNVGDVYRRDAIDCTHYPVFHQLDAVRLFNANDLEMQLFENGEENKLKQAEYTLKASQFVESDLKKVLEGLVRSLFGANSELRWVQDNVYFPFTHPSWELEVFYNNDWLELLGCGIFRYEILKSANAENNIAWAFGMGLERLAMKLYNIPDIRLFWCEDPGFTCQFDVDDFRKDIQYKPFSIYPPSNKDMSMWLKSSHHEHDFYDLVRSIGGDLVEQVKLIDNFKDKKTGRTSRCYRITYRSMEKTLTNNFVNELHGNISQKAVEQLNVTIR